MNNFSLTISGVAVLVLSFLGQQAGVPFVDGQLEQFVGTFGQILGILVTYWGRVRQGDITFLGIKK